MCDCGDNICAFHAERDQMIKEIDEQINNSIGPAINQHKAYWKFFFWGAGIALTIMMGLTVSIYSSSVEISKSVVRLTNFASNQKVRNDFITARQDGQKAKINSLDDRVRNLELSKRGD